MFGTKRKQQNLQPFTSNFRGNQFDYVFDELNNIISVTNFMKRYELSEVAANDLERWAINQKQKYEKALRFVREFDMEPKDWGSQFPKITDWYESLSEDYKKQHITLYDLNKAVYKEKTISDHVYRMIVSDYKNYMPAFGRIENPDEDELDPSEKKGLICIDENGVRYTSPNIAAVEERISTYWQTQLRREPSKRPTMKEFYESLGMMNGLNLKAEKFKEPIEMDLEIDLERYKYL